VRSGVGKLTWNASSEQAIGKGYFSRGKKIKCARIIVEKDIGTRGGNGSRRAKLLDGRKTKVGSIGREEGGSNSWGSAEL